MNGNKKNALVIIDPQNDFCDQRGSLYVEGAYADSGRLADHVRQSGRYYDDIMVSLDSHDVNAIFHPVFWRDADGNCPQPYTVITPDDFQSGRWRARSLENQERASVLFEILSRKSVEYLMVWPEHCVVSTWGHQIVDILREGLRCWREATGSAVRYVFKGENPYTDQFSLFEGLDDSWPETRFDEALFSKLASFDTLTFAGQALSHCVEATINSYLDRLAPASGQRISLLRDCTSPVGGFSREESEERLAVRGVELLISTEGQ